MHIHIMHPDDHKDRCVLGDSYPRKYASLLLHQETKEAIGRVPEKECFLSGSDRV
jgi:hypothetical protein